MKRLLLIVDPQNDFIDGSLPVPGAAGAMDRLAAKITAQPDYYDCYAVTCDWHPENHCSFVANSGEWPNHCVMNSRGAQIWPALALALQNSGRPVHVLHKGNSPEHEEYSIFSNAESASRLNELLAKVDIADVCGIAGDICVLNTVRDGVAIHGWQKFNVLPEFSPSLDGGAALDKYLKEARQCAR